MGHLSRFTGEFAVVTGLRAEARLFGDGAMAGGGTPAGAEAAAESLARAGAPALLSFGLAGGLDPALRSGAIVLPRRVVSASGRWEADPDLLSRLGGATMDLLYAGDEIVVNVEAKAALFAATSASAIDLESGAVAAVAGRHGLPFAVLRAVCDPAGRTLPEAALRALDGNGAIGFGRVLASLLRRPGQLAALLALARDAASARRSLSAIVRSRGLAAG